MEREPHLDRRSRGYSKTGLEMLRTLHPGPKSVLTGLAIIASGFLLGMILYGIGAPSISAPQGLAILFIIGCGISGIVCLVGMAWIVLSAPKIVDWLKTGAWMRKIGIVFFLIAGVLLLGFTVWHVYLVANRQKHGSILVPVFLVIGASTCFGFCRSLHQADTSKEKKA